MDRCAVVEYLRTAATRTGVPRASPTASGNKPAARASHLMVVNVITTRASTHTQTPRKNVRRMPMASVSEPTSSVTRVMEMDHAATNRPAPCSA
ncbi:MAG: hypothetical protein BWX84_02838 [Verrucomicrobia bacterium ADurb.Bin118]|nr:MAG: hypothetical protein BWX84_02838 [Verrucomicrobia bacterium ADurb.Bin118]